MKPLKCDYSPAVESLGAAMAEAGIRVNTRGCKPMTPQAAQAIDEAARKLREHYRGKLPAGSVK